MRGGKPGYFPTFAQLPHPVPFSLFDPFGFSKNASPEKKAKGLLAEVNNGRLAQIGIMGFLAESQVPGSVPGLAGVGIRPYAGDIMALRVLVAMAVEEQVPENVDPSVEIELTRQVELDTLETLETVEKEGAELSFELPKKVLGACWPLIAMWPVLYAGYQAEIALGILPAP